MTTIADELQKIRERSEKATPGPWRIHATSEYVLETEDGNTIGCLGGHDRLVQNGEFIAHARTDIPRLLACVERLVEGHHKIADGFTPEGIWQYGLMNAAIDCNAFSREALSDASAILTGESEKGDGV